MPKIEDMEFGLFAYGTIMRRDFYNPRPDVTVESTMDGVLYDLGGFPGMVPGEGTVEGVLHFWKDKSLEEDFLGIWDRYEAEGKLYRRKRFSIFGKGYDVNVWYYEFIPLHTTEYLVIEDGKWKGAGNALF